MNINKINNFNFCANIPYTNGAKRVETILNKADEYDCAFSYTNYIEYEKLCNLINEILPSDNDTVSFNSVQDKNDLEKDAYKVDGNVIHNGKNKNFSINVFCSDGSFAVGKTIMNSIKKAADIKNTDLF